MIDFKILDKSIFYLGKKSRKVNGVGTVVYYFNRLIKTSMLPIEVSVVDLGKDLVFFSPQLNSYSLTQNKDKASYLNSIVFYKDPIRKEIEALEDEKVENDTVKIFKDIFQFDLSNIEGIDGLVFDRIIYTEDFKVKNSELRSDGYIFVFTDMALRRSKFGYFAGNLRNQKFNEYVQDINEYGASNILNNVTIKQDGYHTTIKNNTHFHIEVQPYDTKYNIEPKEYGEKIYTRERNKTSIIVLRPFEEFELHNDNVQQHLEYSLLDNPIKQSYYNDSFSNYGEVYPTQKDLIRLKPYEFEILRIGLEPNVTENIEDYILITAFDTIDKLDEVSYSIINKDNSAVAVVKGEYGKVIADSDKVAYNVSPIGMKDRFIKGFANTALFRIDSSQYVFDYSFKEADTFITEIAYKNAFNNTTSQFMPSLIIKTATIADYGDFEAQNTKIKIEEVSYTSGKLAALPYLMKTDLFRDDVLMVDLNEISEMDTRPPYGHYIFKTFVKELDDVVEEFMKKRKQAVANFKFIDIPLEVSSKDIAEFSPTSDVWRYRASSKEQNNFVYKIKQHLSDLGYQIALEEALKKLKKVAYVFAPVKNIIATNVFGVTLDKEWYFIGSNWYRAEEVENPKITTYINDKIKEYDVEVGKYRYMYVKKTFFGYDNDTNEMISYAKAFAECIGMNKPIPSDLLIQNPALAYIMEHTIDNDRSYPVFNEVVTYPTEFVNKYIEKDLKNKYTFPNLFRQSYNQPFHPGLYSSARASELSRVVENDAIDVLNSVEKIEVDTSAFLLFDHNALKAMTPMFTGVGYQILGIEDDKYGNNAVVKFVFKIVKNVVMNGYGYDLGIEIIINGERRYGMYYNLTTKKTGIFLAKEVKITDYSFMISLFDSILLYNVNEINGYKFKELGEFVLEDETGAEIDSKYIYLPIEHPVESNYNLVGVSVNYINTTIFLDTINNTSETVKYNLGKDMNKKTLIPVSAKINKEADTITLKKAGAKSIDVDLISLRNLPTKTIAYNGFVIKPYRLSKTLPAIYADRYLTSLSAKITIGNETRYVVVKYGEPLWVDFKMIKQIYNPKTKALVEEEVVSKRVVVGLDDRGFVYAVNVHNHMSDFTTVYSLEEIFNNDFKEKDLELKVDILLVEGGLL